MKMRHLSLGVVTFACALPVLGQPVEPKAGTCPVHLATHTDTA
jgi:hypothetical protein